MHLLDLIKKPSKTQWAQFFKPFNLTERIIFSILFVCFIGSAIFLINNIYKENTIEVPYYGGSIKIGMVGQPQHINPAYSIANEIDRSIVEMVYSSLMTFDEFGELEKDLIENYEFKENGKVFEFSIKQNVKWHDNTPLTMDDVVFTINLVQDTEYASSLRTNWQGIKIEKISDFEGRMTLLQPYSGFLETLANLKIIPKHFLEEVPAQSLSSEHSINITSPIGSGPYIISNVKESNGTVLQIDLKANNEYFGKRPYISKISIIFFEDENELKTALQKKSVNMGILSTKEDIDNLLSIETPNYFSVFINNNNDILSNVNIRKALEASIDKGAFTDLGTIINSPILPAFYGFSIPEPSVFSQETATQLLEEEGFILDEETNTKTRVIEKVAEFSFNTDLNYGAQGTAVEKLQECLAQDPEVYPDGTISGYFGTNTKEAVMNFQEKYKDEILTPYNLSAPTGKVGGATREKLNELCYPSPTEETVLSFTLKTTDHETLKEIAEKIKNDWENIGIKVNIEIYSSKDIKKIIRERDYDLLLFGETLSAIPDPLSFWHSSQIIDPGVNLSIYENEKSDKLLEEARLYYDSQNPNRIEKLEQFQDLFLQDIPAILLYSSDLNLYFNKISGISIQKIADSSKIFSNIENWYVKTKRVWK